LFVLFMPVLTVVPQNDLSLTAWWFDRFFFFQGKLCILDWGMVTSIPPQLQLTLIEHMAHLTSGDYAEVPRDLFLLGFVPADKEKAIEDSGVVDVLANIYGQWTAGGGLKTINANDVLNEIQDLAAQKGNLFQIPPYFAYIAKSFSVLEGIGLSNDPKYSIINECLPYVSNRLLTDTDNMGRALNTFIFGPDKNNVATRLVNTKRVEQLVTGFSNFTAASASGVLSNPGQTNSKDTAASASFAGGSGSATRLEMMDKVADQVLDIVLTEEETPLQDILIEQLCKILAANTRTFWTEARLRSGVLPNGRTLLGTLVDPLGVFQTSPLVNACDQDERTVEMTRDLVNLFRGLQQQQQATALNLQSMDSQELLAFSRILSRKIWDRRASLIRSSNRFLSQMLELTAMRLENSDRIPVRGREPTISSTPTSSTAISSSNSTYAVEEPPIAASYTKSSKATTPSSRLRAARDRLDSFSN
jgi:hypothetical protein